MVRRSNFAYQIDRRHKAKNRADNDDDEDDGDSSGNDNVKSDDNDGNYEQGESEDDDDEEESEDDDDKVITKRPAKPKTATTNGRPKRASSDRQPARKKSNSEDESEQLRDSDEDDGNVLMTPTRRRGQKTAPSRSSPHTRATVQPPSNRQKRSPGNKKVAAAGAATPKEDEESGSEPEWPEEKDDSDDEDFVPTKSGRKRKGTTDNSDSGSSSEDDNLLIDDDDEEELVDEYKPALRSRERAKSRRPPPKRQRRRLVRHYDDSEDDDFDAELDDDDDDEVIGLSTATNSRSRRASSSANGRKSYKEVESDEEKSGEEQTMISAKSRPRRDSAYLATKKMAELNSSHDEDDDHEEEEHKDPASNRSKQMSSDEEFLADSASENSDEKDVGYTDSEDEEEVENDKTSAAGRMVKAASIDNDDIGCADESSSSEDRDNVSGAQSAARAQQTPNTLSSKSQRDEIRSSLHKFSCDSDENSDDDKGKLIHCSKIPSCPSLEDAITVEPLPKIHVCYVSPDGQSRQCFAIETLRQIALKSGCLPFRFDLDGSTKDTFLQPPHFRTAMSDDLLDQIASRFGRDALNLHGDFYNRKPRGALSSVNSESDDIYENIFGNDDDAREFGEDFFERVQGYMSRQMGSRDVYACPLCYSEMHRRIVQMDQKPQRSRQNNEDEDEESTDNDEAFLQLPADSSYDPMTVLGWLDNDKFQAASCFCFGKVANLKKHLRNDHSVQTKGIQGNDLYLRFRIRGPDGLLQRYLHNHWTRLNCTSFQGAMSKYWFEGNNQSFVYLMDLTDRAQFFLEVLQEGDVEDGAYEQGEAYFKPAIDFFKSMQGRAQLEWDHVSSPFLGGAQDDDLQDFLVEESDDPQDESSHMLAHRQFLAQEESDSNDLIHKLERKYVENEKGSSSSEDDEFPSDSENEDEHKEEISVTSELNQDGFYSEEESEKDDWVNSIRSKLIMKKSPSKSKPKASTPTVETTPKGRKLTLRKSTTPSSAATVASLPTPASKRRTIAEEDSSDDDF